MILFIIIVLLFYALCGIFSFKLATNLLCLLVVIVIVILIVTVVGVVVL